jgi:tetraacyldisaccharide 4'-kinase
MRPPEFWSRKDFAAQLAAAAVSPIGWAYGATVAWKRDHGKRHRTRARVVCVGNLTVGGAGKTPVAIAIARAFAVRNAKVVILTRGYAGSISGPLLVDPARHDAHMVGDEALLLADVAPTIVARDRRAGALLAEECGAEVIVMDDGYQNFAIEKDFSLVVVDAEEGFGNGNVVPAGPLREPLSQGLARADAVLLMGNGDPALPDFMGPVLRARLSPFESIAFGGMRAIAFAGIGRPQKFFATLKNIGAELIGTYTYPDHHFFSVDEIARMKAYAHRTDAVLVTTEKDYVRLRVDDRKAVLTLPVRAVFEYPGALECLLDRVQMRELASP